MKKYPITISVLWVAFGIFSGIFITALAGTKEVYQLNNFEVVDVYDGDTFFVTFPCWHPLVGERIGIRVNGIDTPEMRGKSYREKFLAKEAKAFAIRHLEMGQCIELHNAERGKYFRIVADVIIDGNSLADMLVDKNLAVEYDGGTKTIDWSKQ